MNLLSFKYLPMSHSGNWH